MRVTKTTFGKYLNRTVYKYEVTNFNGASISLIEFGARLISVNVPDVEGALDDVVLGYDNLQDYINDENSFGATNGRVSGRIANGKMSVDGKVYDLETNLGDHHIHGGSKGLKKSLWSAETFESREEAGVTFTIVSPDGDDGYPGNLKVTATYTWNEQNELHFSLEAETDKTCPVNLTQHAYFNLAGKKSEDVKGHELLINAQKRLEYYDDGIPTGEIIDNIGTPFDLTFPTILRDALAKNECFDVDMVLEGNCEMNLAAELSDPVSERKLEIHTSRPAIHVYTANHLDKVHAKRGAVYNKYAGVSLEPQHYPDSVHNPQFPDTLLKPGEVFKAKIIKRLKNL
ncbi:MAG: galactose mutarotase [Lentisphaerales bacterium]|nr:galactose mutarotase [Lentisphaerales bacterium]